MIFLSFRAVYRTVRSDGRVGIWHPIATCEFCGDGVTYESREELESAISDAIIDIPRPSGTTLEFRRIAIYEGIIE